MPCYFNVRTQLLILLRLPLQHNLEFKNPSPVFLSHPTLVFVELAASGFNLNVWVALHEFTLLLQFSNVVVFLTAEFLQSFEVLSLSLHLTVQLIQLDFQG